MEHFKVGDIVKPKDKQMFETLRNLSAIKKMEVTRTDYQSEYSTTHVVVRILEGSSGSYHEGDTMGVYNVDLELFEKRDGDYEIF